MFKSYFALILCAVTLSACNINSSIMLQAKKDYPYSIPPLAGQSPEYRISSNDIIEFRIFSNDGARLIDSEQGAGSSAAIRGGASMEYRVDAEGMVRLPVIGKFLISGMTVREAELALQQKYNEQQNRPFITLNVSNRRVIIFPGEHGSARVLPLMNNNITLMEALAMAGGISQNGKAKRIKLIRGSLSNPEVFLINLSRIEGLKQADIVLQANDIIYVEPRLRITQGVIAEIAPYVTLITTAILLITFSRQINN
jgi:polysaccharide biosynthesis/export protein